jgi:hypothetical protein
MQQPTQDTVHNIPLIPTEVQITPMTPEFGQALKKEQEKQAKEQQQQKKETVNNG